MGIHSSKCRKMQQLSMNIIQNHLQSVRASVSSLLLWRNFPNAWNKVIFSSLPHDGDIWELICPYPECEIDNKTGLVEFNLQELPLKVDAWMGKDSTCFRQECCKDIMACLMSPPLNLAIWSSNSAGTLHFSSWQILVSLFLMEFSVIGVNATCNINITHENCC